MNATNSQYQTTPTQRPIESASASTQPQTNPSRFAYILTACVLGLITLLVLAITLLLYTAFSTYYLSTDVPDYLYEESPDVWGPRRDDENLGLDEGFMSDYATLL